MALLGLAGGAPLNAGDTDVPDAEKIEEIETRAAEERARAQEMAERAEALAEELRALRARAIAAARRTQELESELSALESTLTSLEAEEKSKSADLDARRGQLADTLAALQRIAVLPPEAIAGSPESPLEVVRGAALLGVAVPAIEARAEALRRDLETLDSLRADIETQRAEVRTAAQALAAERHELAEVQEQTQQRRERALAESRTLAQRAEALAAEAADMRDLLRRLEEEAEERAKARARAMQPPPAPPEDEAADSAEAPDASETAVPAPPRDPAEAQEAARLARPDNIRPFPDERNSLLAPARGDLVARYGEPISRAGATEDSRGIVLATRPQAQVVAPFDGEIAYAGPFRGYGRILIIEHRGRYHTLLAGLERIDAIVGQWVLAGEPVGVMGGADSGSPEIYVELRRAGQPINPLPWLTEIGDKVQG